MALFRIKVSPKALERGGELLGLQQNHSSNKLSSLKKMSTKTSPQESGQFMCFKTGQFYLLTT